MLQKREVKERERKNNTIRKKNTKECWKTAMKLCQWEQRSQKTTTNRKTEKHLKERERRRKCPISEPVTVTALTEERGESFIKAAHDCMAVTYLYCFDLNCQNWNWFRKSCTHPGLHFFDLLEWKESRHFVSILCTKLRDCSFWKWNFLLN